MIQSKTNIEDPAFLGRNHLSLINNHLAFGPSTTVESPLQISSFMQNKPNFPDDQMNVNKVITKDYENIANWKVRKNKANTKPNKANLLKAKINVNFYSTKDYENIANCALAENKPNSKPIQTQTKPMLVRHQCGGSKPKLKPSKAELIKRIWGYKSTIALTFARNSLILPNGDVRYLMLIASGIKNLRFETACIEKGDK